jgi:hypothetical protein
MGIMPPLSPSAEEEMGSQEEVSCHLRWSNAPILVWRCWYGSVRSAMWRNAPMLA